MDWVRVNSYLFHWLYYVSFSTHPFCLCLAMITWLVMWEHMWIQVRMPMHSDGVG